MVALVVAAMLAATSVLPKFAACGPSRRELNEGLQVNPAGANG
ncbi:hypothetical protein [Roseateles sp. DXS20W]